MKFFPAFLLAFAMVAVAQTPSNHLPGTVTAVNAPSNQISVKTAQGDLTFTATERTQILRAQAGVADPKQWPRMTLAEIAAGDEVVAYIAAPPIRNRSSPHRWSFAPGPTSANSPKSNWRTGKSAAAAVPSVPSTSGQDHHSEGRAADHHRPGRRQDHVRRYSPDSAKPEDAKASTLAGDSAWRPGARAGKPQ